MIITSTGFFNTGSSAVTGILQEFSCIESSGDVFEVRVLYDPDCVRDLQYNLVDFPHRHNTSNAIKRFKKYVDFNTNKLLNHHYEELFNNNFKKLSYEYINDLSDVIYKGYYHADFYNRGKFFFFKNRCYQKFVRTFFYNTKLMKKIPFTLLPKNELCYGGTSSKEKFLAVTQKYTEALLKEYNKKNSPYILIDQLFPATNIDDFFPYLPQNQECKVFVVERDPRDLYVSAKCFLNLGVVPTENVDTFCDWYLWTRGQVTHKSTSQNVMYVQFEDLIYKYEEMRQKVCDFIGIDINSECKPKTHFNPEKSVNNTQTWIRFKDKISEEEIKTIERRLEKYCYNFPSDGIKPDFTKLNMFDC